MLTYARAPSGEKATNCGPPSGTGIRPVTTSRAVSKIVNVPEARLAM
jgi:hypothetical protein